MARYLGPKCKLSRREGTDLMNTSGLKSFEDKCRSDKTPGVHWARRSRHTDYGVQLRMKQLVKRYYSVLEKQFGLYYKQADRMKGSTGDNLLRILESRLDNMVYRMGFASTRSEARQLVAHKGILVNGKVVNICSYQVSINDEIEVRPKAKKQLRVKAALELAKRRAEVSWINVNEKDMKGTVAQEVDLEELPAEFKVNLIVELYSK